MDKQTDLTLKLLLNSNSRGVVDEVVSFEENLEDTEYAEELTDGNLREEVSGTIVIRGMSMSGTDGWRPTRCSVEATNNDPATLGLNSK
ncbi:hypothetical protein Q0F98_21235 [Paenibacillus amylolyticus]|nr:hypothetical protein Q0F98_21235 [Paenibacillus amylolyticus]